MAAPYYTAKLGSHTFTVAPGFRVTSSDVTRKNSAPPVLVARNYVWLLRCRVPDDTPAASVVALAAFLAAAVATRTVPTFLRIEDAAAVPVPQIGNVVTGTAEEWEDLQVTAFDLEDRDGQLVAGSWFELGFAARRSFPDANGVCEFDQEYESESDDAGNETNRLTTTIRLAQSSPNTITGTAAITAQLKLPAPVGWTRTRGSSPLDFDYRYPLYPLTHLAQTVSEVKRTVGSAGGGSGGATDDLTHRQVDVPERGIRRVTLTAETSLHADPLAWVESNAPSEYVVQELQDTGTDGTAQGEWTSLDPLAAGRPSGKTTKVTRTYTLVGGKRAAGAILMTPPGRARLQRGAFQAYELTEVVEIRALGVTDVADFAVPAALGSPWALLRLDEALPRVEEDAVDPSQRLWLWVVTRTYQWDATGDPHSDTALIRSMLAASREVF